MKKRLALILVFAIVLSALPICSFAAEKVDPYFYGTGTAADPYLIQTPEDLANLVYLTNNLYADKGLYNSTDAYTIPGTSTSWTTHGKAGYYCGRWGGSGGNLAMRYYKMTADLDMKDYTFDKGGIGGGTNGETAFFGHFDGNGHIIKNWKSTSSGGTDFNGKFSFVKFGLVEGGGIENVGVEDSMVKSDNYICGVLVGRFDVYGKEENGIANCYVKRSTSYSAARSGSLGNYVGGVVGMVQYYSTNGDECYTSVKNCYTYDVTTYFTSGEKDFYHFGSEIAGVIGGVTTQFGFAASTPRHLVAENLYSVADKANGNCIPAVGRCFTHETIATNYELKNCYQLDEDNSTTWTNQATNENGITLSSSSFSNDSYASDTTNVNNGYPVLAWEYERYNKSEAAVLTVEFGEGDINVYIKGGTYNLKNSVKFEAENSGTEDREIIYQPYPGETVKFTGSTPIDTSKIQKVTDDALLNRLSEDYAKDNLYMVNLTEQGIDLPAIASDNSSRKQRIFMNGSALTNARWPNADKSGENYFIGAHTAKLTSAEEGKYNAGGQPVILNYHDTEKRSAKWQFKENDMYMTGAIAYLWWQEAMLLKSLDTENLRAVSSTNAGYGQSTYTSQWERYVFFENVFEEIDQPGESYLDRETGILYFYPVGSVKNAEMSIATFGSSMFTVNGASYITFKDIDFGNSRTTAIEINADHVTVDGAEISGMGYYGVNIKGNDNTVKNSNIYDVQYVGVIVDGGDCAKVEASGNLITNNYIHDGTIATAKGIDVTGCGNVISHNEIYNFNMEAIITKNIYAPVTNTLIEYNYIHDCQLINSDGGAIYSGRDMQNLGTIIRYNYFRDIGCELGAHGQQSIFADDATTCPAIYGNIFVNGGGGSPEFTIKTNGGQFAQIFNNIFIDNEAAIYMQDWGQTYSTNKKIPSNWWLSVQDLKIGSTQGMWFNNPEIITYSRKDLVFSDAWKEYYTKTEPTGFWAKFFDYINPELYAQAQKLQSAGDEAAYAEWIDKNIPEGHTNFVYNNVTINVDELLSSAYTASWCDDKNNVSYSKSEGKKLFKNYGTDFTLTEEGLAEIRKTLPEFENIEFSKMGVLGSISKPTVKNATVFGSGAVGKTLSATYDFEDSKTVEGQSKIYWYYANSEKGTYKRIDGGFGKYFVVTSEYENKCIRYEVVPYSLDFRVGDGVASKAVYIDPNATNVDKDGLWKIIGKVNSALEEAVVGDEGGQYSKADKDALTVARDKAIGVANNTSAYQYQVTEALFMVGKYQPRPSS